jgi:poly-gamma-glutamate synthesis protein (capsule biosynthesis protein)
MDTVKLLFTGDFCPHNRIEELSEKKDYPAVFNDFMDVFRGNDLNITDIECPLTLTAKRIPKTGPYQFAAPHTIELLKYAGVQLASMANNHIMDCDAEGAIDTMNLCRQAGISTVGIGLTEEERRKPFSTEIKGKKIAVINFAENEFITAPGGEAGANPMDLIKNYQDITNAKKEHDFVLLMLHGGNEFYHLPSPRMKELYRFFIDIGADAIVSYHTHCLSGYELYKGKPIFYALGNFLYDWPEKVNTDWNFGYLVRFTLTDKVNFEIIPHKQNNGIPGIFHLDQQEKKVFEEKISRLNSIIADDKKLAAAFDAYCNSVKKMYDAFLEPGFGNFIASLRARGLFPKFITTKKRRLLLNITRCESHRDVLLHLLSKK